MGLKIVTTWITAGAGTFLIYRMIRTGHSGAFGGVYAYLIQHVLWGWLLSAVYGTTAGLITFVVSLPVEWAFATWAAIHLLGKAFDAWPGIRTATRWATLLATVISVAAASVSVFLIGGGGNKITVYRFLEVADRSVLGGLSVVVILTAAIVLRYPLRLRQNTWLSLGGFSMVLLSIAGARLLDSVSPSYAHLIADNLQLLFEASVYCIWARFLVPEAAEQPARAAFSHAQEQELLLQLEAMNGILQRAGRS